MTYEDIHNYLIPALLNLGFENNINDAIKLDKLLGVDWYEEGYREWSRRRISMSEEARNLYRQLAGPHAQTILKAYRIKRGLDASKENQDRGNQETSQG